MDISPKALELLKQWEGFKNHTYLDPAGLLTIGVGHLVTASEKAQGYIIVDGAKLPLDKELLDIQVIALLNKDVTRFVENVNKVVKIKLSQNQFDALVCFSFNVGIGAFNNSTLLKLINQGRLSLVQKEFRKWVKAGGKTIQGLVNRRNNEIKLWEGKL